MKHKAIIEILIIIFFISNIQFIISSKSITKNITSKNFYHRLLLEEGEEYDKTFRELDELDSIEHCEDADYKYFFQYVSGYNVSFDKQIIKEYAVSLI